MSDNVMQCTCGIVAQHIKRDTFVWRRNGCVTFANVHIIQGCINENLTSWCSATSWYFIIQLKDLRKRFIQFNSVAVDKITFFLLFFDCYMLPHKFNHHFESGKDGKLLSIKK